MLHQYIDAYHKHLEAAETALTLLHSWCAQPLPRVPGMSSVIRLAWRIACGRSIEEAAAYEYIYRWKLAIKPGDQVTISDNVGRHYGGVRPYRLNCRWPNDATSIFGTPHTIGM